MALFRIDFIDYTTEIDAPVEEVFAFFKEVDKWPSWTTCFKKVCCKSTGDWRIGFRISFVTNFLPVPTESPLVAYKENRTIAWGKQSKLSTIIHSFDFKAIDDERCSVRHAEFAEGLLGIILRPLKKQAARFVRQFADDLQAAFKKRAECS